MKLIDITDAKGTLIEPTWLQKAEPVHRQLRVALPENYVARMQTVFANGARLLIATDGEQVLGLALWRLIENTYEGLRLYVDDLVTDEKQRSTGVGKLLLDHLEMKANALNCDVLALDSGVQRTSAHKFYLRENLVITGFNFKKKLL